MRMLAEAFVVTTLFGRLGTVIWFALDLGLVLLVAGLVRSARTEAAPG